MKKVLVLSTAIVLATTCFAVDGVVLINQASVMAAGGFPYQITQPGSYRLSSNLLVPSGASGIIINADNVTLDLNGFSIIGPGVCLGGQFPAPCPGFGDTFIFGVFSGNDNITVRNGSITGMTDFGISLNGFGNLLEEVHAKFNNIGIAVDAGVVRRCTASRNLQAGIEAFLSVVESSASSGNGGSGMIARDSTVTNNTLNNNGGPGLDISFSVYGSNTTRFNSISVLSGTGNTSQKNNNCEGTTC